MEQHLCDGCTKPATPVATLGNGTRIALCDDCARTVTVALVDDSPFQPSKEELDTLKAMMSGDKP